MINTLPECLSLTMKNILISIIIPDDSVEILRDGLGAVGVQSFGTEPHCYMEGTTMIEESFIRITCTHDEGDKVREIIKELHPDEDVVITTEIIDQKGPTRR